MCDWLEPQARKINERIKQAGGFKITEIRDGIECVTEIHEFDLFHSLLGDINPGSINAHTKGGHLFIHDLKGSLLEFDTVKNIGDGFFDLGIRYSGKGKGYFKQNTYFPMGTTIDDAVAIIEDVILNPKYFKIADNIKDPARYGYKMVNNKDQSFILIIKENKIQFFPYNE